MIISASRRTDIPAFYGKWFINRLRAGEVLVRNPMNYNQISSIPLDPETVDCIVFWTKDPVNFIKYLDEIDKLGYRYYFQFTLNSYGKDIERDVNKKSNIINTFKKISKRIGPDRIIWRYDPIIFNKKYTLDYHLKWYSYIADQLRGYTKRCVISFLKEYKKIEGEMHSLEIQEPNWKLIKDISKGLSQISSQNDIDIMTCDKDIDLNEYGVTKSPCIDKELIEKIIKTKIKVNKVNGQRKECGCIDNRDIGSYSSCGHFCSYCYANCSNKAVLENIKKYNPNSQILCDSIIGSETITKYKGARSLKVTTNLQPEFF